VPDSVWRRFIRYAPVDLPAELVRWAPAVPVLRRFGDAVLPQALAARTDLLACRVFDRWSARRLAASGAAGVIACEISALATFRAAKRLGWVTILDAPSLHHAAQDRLHGFTGPKAVHGRVVAVKDAEIELADHVLTVSEFARSTYVEAGVPADRVHALPLGADLDLFPARGPGDVPHGRLRLLFCGAQLRRKGFDVLCEALAAAVGQGLDAELLAVGPRGDATESLARLPAERVRWQPPVSQPELGALLRTSDCLVLPSRNDSFGMVVVEALASGVPVVVSEHVGASTLVTQACGFRVPAGDPSALSDLLLRLGRGCETLRGMTDACRAAARTAGWPAYHARLAELIERLLR
jgi:glycosyltransferase involved in cell wall biosynthesis